METLPKRTVVDTLQASQEYGSHLKSLLEAVNSAESQVESSSQNASHQVETVIEDLKDRIIAAILARKKALLELVEKSRQDALTPLRLCRAEINKKIDSNEFFIGEAMGVLKTGGFTSPESCTNFLNNSSALGTLPAVPEIELIPNITFLGSSNDALSAIIDIISSFGKIFQIGPVQITDLEPKPGALLVKWDDVDFDYAADDHQYKLQMALGDVKDVEGVFRDVYKGPETEFLVTDLKYEQKYSFRVCVGTSASQGWSPWSLVKTSCTNIPPYSWDSTNTNFDFSDNCRLAKVIVPESVLFSNGAQITNGNSVHFTLFCKSEPLSEEGVGIAVTNKFQTNSLIQLGVFFVSFHGDVYIDGVKKMICLPKMSKRSKIIFSCELVNGRWRINVESSLKAVTYEWAAKGSKLFFATSLSQPNVQVLVE